MNLQSGLVALNILAKIANLVIIYPMKEKQEKKTLKNQQKLWIRS